jgi:hypothetical protein
VRSSRIVKTEDYGPRWRFHHLWIRAEADMNDELRGWLQESHDVVGLQTNSGPSDPADEGQPVL